jgi:hypothetical protein
VCDKIEYQISTPYGGFGSALIVETPGPGRYAIATFTDAAENDYVRLTRVTSS